MGDTWVGLMERPAPAFALPDQHGRIVRSDDLLGSWVVLWWYPQAATPG